jgi:MFS family permease
MNFNLVEPAAAAARAAGTPVVAVRPLRIDAALVRVCALFAIGWLAQVAFLAQQLPLLVPKVGAAWATLAVAATTASALLGRLVMALLIDRLSHRVATAASFGLQAVGSVLLLASDRPEVVVAGCVLIGFSVGNVITLPALFAQREFAAAHYAQVVTRINSSGQMLYAFGPMVAGLLLARSGSADSTLLSCLACQLVALALCARFSRAT